MNTKIYFTLPLVIRDFKSYFSNILILKNTFTNTIIKSIYGSFPGSEFGTGRPYKSIGYASKNDFKKIIDCIQKEEIEFNYCLNAPSFHGQEGEARFLKKLNSFLLYLNKIGINKITLSNPYLIYYVSDQYPNFDITISSYLFLDSLQAIEIFSNINNVTTVVLSQKLNRKIDLINSIYEYLKSMQKEIILILDLNCSDTCPLYYYHSSISGYSKKGSDLKNLNNFIGAFCTNQKKLSSYNTTYIEPDRAISYVQSGIRYFKIQGRQLTQDIVINNIRKYFTVFNNSI